MALTIPNTPSSPTAEQSTQSGPDQRDFDALLLGYDETYVVSGCAVTGNANMAPSVAAGVVCVGGTEATVTGGTVTITTADATNPRIDLIVADNAGAKSVIAGTPAAAFDATHPGPVMPAITAGRVLLASVYVAAGTNSIATADCTDKRVIVSKGGPQAADVTTSETTTSTSYADLTTAGPTVTAQIGISGKALVIIAATLWTTSGVHDVRASLSVDGATPVDADAVYNNSSAHIQGSRPSIVTGLSPGSHTFKVQYKADSNIGTFINRRIVVVPL